MKKTLLLCFIHGFKGGDDTFGSFPEHLRALVSHALPKVDVAVITYPKFETRGDLHECVGKFREWLQSQVIDIEVEKRTPSPTIDPSTRVILVGHSMGGIVAADTVLAIVSEKPISSAPEATTFMFPYIQGILAFDTPYLGIAPGVVAHGAEGHYNKATSAFGTISEVASVFGWGSPIGQDSSNRNLKKAEAPKALPAAVTAEDEDAAASPAWQRWGKIAMYAGAAGAIAAGGAAAFVKREQISEGWSWVTGHLEFVGCLMRGEELRKRLSSIVKLEEDHGLGFADLYTSLGAAAAGSSSALGVGEQRTFCVLPKGEIRKMFIKQVNDAAKDETQAHMSMFYPKDNPGYYNMSEQAKELVVHWASNDWYESSTGEMDSLENEGDLEV